MGPCFLAYFIFSGNTYFILFHLFVTEQIAILTTDLISAGKLMYELTMSKLIECVHKNVN